MFLYLAALFPSMLLFSIYRKKNKITIAPHLLSLFSQNTANLGLLFILYIGKKTLFGLISAKYDKLGRAAALFSLLYLIFVANYSFILYREKDNYCVFILFSIGENTKLSVYHREKKGTKDD